MAGDRVNNYSQIDSNILELQLTADKTFKGYHQLTLTNYDNTTVPAIAAGSAIECNGALYKFDTEEAISTTDPVTSATVADGTVYVCIIPDTTTATAAFTATAPTWSDSKQGWYGTGGQANYRYVNFMLYKNSSSWGKGGIDKNFKPLILFYGKALGTQNYLASSEAILFNNVIIDFSGSYNNSTGYYSPVNYFGLYYIYTYITWGGTNTNAIANVITDVGTKTITTLSNVGSSKICKIGHAVSCLTTLEESRVRMTNHTDLGYILSDSYLIIKRVQSIEL